MAVAVAALAAWLVSGWLVLRMQNLERLKVLRPAAAKVYIIPAGAGAWAKADWLIDLHQQDTLSATVSGAHQQSNVRKG